MKNKEKEEVPLDYMNRNPVFIAISALITLLLLYTDYILLTEMNPWGFLLMVPAAFMFFQTLWLLLHPYAVIFEDKFEIQQSLFYQKQCYFIDIQKTATNKKGQLILVYRDEDQVAISLFGMQKNKVEVFKKTIENSIRRIAN